MMKFPTNSRIIYITNIYFFNIRWKDRKWKKRDRIIDPDPFKTSMFVRIYTVSPKNIEFYALRTLLLHVKGPRDFNELRKVPIDMEELELPVSELSQVFKFLDI